jgi:hypothetical protein
VNDDLPLGATYPPGISCSNTLESLDMDMASLSARSTRVISRLFPSDSKTKHPQGLVESPDLGPVQVERLYIIEADPSPELGLLKSGTDGSHGGLRGASAHAVDRTVHDIGTGGSTGQHGSDRHTSLGSLASQHHAGKKSFDIQHLTNGIVAARYRTRELSSGL